MSTTENILLKTVMFVGMVVISMAIGLLIAFPIQWSWNYAVVHVWQLPEITWGHAWCLSFLASMLIQSTFSHNNSLK